MFRSVYALLVETSPIYLEMYGQVSAACADQEVLVVLLRISFSSH